MFSKIEVSGLKFSRVLAFLALIPTIDLSRAVGRSENIGAPVVMWGQNLPPPQVEIGLIDMPKSGGTMAPLASQGTHDRPAIKFHLDEK